MLSYIGLFYIVHLEALKLGMQPILRRASRGRWRDTADALRARHLGHDRRLRGASTTCCAASSTLLGDAAPLGIAASSSLALYLVAIREAARAPDLPQDIDVDNPKPLDTWPTVRAGPALPDPDRHADLVPDGRGAVAVALGVLGDRRAGRADARRSGR